MSTIIVIYELMITCVFFADVGTMPVDRLDQLTNFTPESSLSYNPTVVDHSTNWDNLEKIDVKKLLDMLKILSEEKSAGVSVSDQNIGIYNTFFRVLIFFILYRLKHFKFCDKCNGL